MWNPKEVTLSNINMKIIESMYTVFVQNRVCKRGNEFYCYLCKFQEDKLVNILEHIISNKEHQERNKIGEININMLKDLEIDEVKSVALVFNSIISINLQQFHCSICDCSIPTFNHVTDHINGSKHSNKKQSLKNNICNLNSATSKSNLELNSRTENVDAITKIKPIITYYCTTCKISLKFNAEIKYHKMFHISQEKILHKNNDIISFSVQDQNTKYIHCLICNYIINNEMQLENHLEDILHKKRLTTLRHPKVLTVSDDLLVLPASSLNSINSYSNTNTKTTVYKTLFCQICNLCISYESSFTSFYDHIKGKKHEKNLLVFSQERKNIIKLAPIPDDCLPIYRCFICDIEFTEENLLTTHYSDAVHATRVKAINYILQNKNINFIYEKSVIILKCTVCKAKTYDLQSIINHVNSATHKKNEKKCIFDSIEITNKNSIAELNESSIDKCEKLSQHISSPKDILNNIIHRYTCPICEINVAHDYMLIQHLQSKNHKKKVVQYTESASTSLKKLNFLCPMCDNSFCSDMELLEHFGSIKHKNNVDLRLTNKNESNNSEKQSSKSCHSDFEPASSTASLSLNNLEDLDKMDLMFNKLIDFEINPDYKNTSSSLSEEISSNFEDPDLNKNAFSVKKRQRRRKPNKLTSKNISSKHCKNLSVLGEKYVTLCLEAGMNNIFNISSEQIYKLELGVSLTFPFNKGRACMPCGEEISSVPQLFYEHLHDEKHISNLREMEENHRLYENFEDQFSDLELAKSYMHENIDESIQCFACDIEVENLNVSIQSHIKTENHIIKSQFWAKSAKEILENIKDTLYASWYYAEKFVCEICSTKFDSDINLAEHLTQDKHLEKVYEASKNQNVLQFDLCTVCVTYWYGKANGYAVHCNGSLHKYLLKAGDYLIPELLAPVKDFLNCYENMIYSLLEMLDSIDPNIEKEILQSIQEISRTQYPKANVHLFGSRLSGIGFSTSDLDIYLDCEDNYHGVTSLEKCREQLLILQRCFEDFPDIWIFEEVLLNTTIPILKLRHRSTNLYCDISCIDSLSVEKSKLIRYFVKAYPVCHKLILFLKKWTSLCRLSGTEGITTFAVSLLVIFYLQVDGILPSVSQLIKLQNHSNIVAGWETGFIKVNIPVTITNSTKSVKDLLAGFFVYYASFDYITDVICPFLGKKIKKRVFTNFDNLPEEMNLYKKLYREGKAEFFRYDSPMCLQEFIDLSQNLTKAVTKLQLRTFKQYCSESAAILLKAN